MSHKTKEQRREEAARRQAAYDALTPAQRLARAHNPHRLRGGGCAREEARLLKANPKLARVGGAR